jgi:branched-chain amino acid transport system permease protein
MKSTADRIFPIKVGLLGGLIAVLIGWQGMLQAFSARDIIGNVISMGHMLILIALFATGYIAITRSSATRLADMAVAGALSGFIASGMLVVSVWLGNVLPLGAMLVNATPKLYELLTFNQGLVVGSFLLMIVGVVVGVLCALVLLLPSKIRQPIITALVWVIALGTLQDLVTVTLSNFDVLAPVVKLFYGYNGLSLIGAVIIFVLIGALSYLWSEKGKGVQSKVNRLPPTSQRALRGGGIFLCVVILLLLPNLLGLYLSEVLDNVGLYLLMGLGLNIVVGFAGLLDLGYVAFFAIGAYTVGVLTSPELGRAAIMGNWWLALPFGVGMAALAGILLGIPVLKMRGDYLAIVTLGFGEIIRLLALSDLFKPYFGGAQGARSIPAPNIGPLQITWHPQEFYYLFLAGCLLVIFISTRVKSSRLGRAWMAVREDEDVAQAMGIDLVATKLMAFAMGASFGGLSGAIFASKLASIFPHSFNFMISINVLCLIIIGGMGSIPGVVIGALALVGLPELLREFAEFRFLIYGIVLVVMMLTRPEGLVPEARRAMELEEFREEEGPDKEPVVMKTMGQP